MLAQSSLESQRSELEGEVETGLPFKRKSWSSEKIYDIFPRHDFNILVNHSEMCKCQHEYVANENRFSLQSDEAKNEKHNNHMKKSEKCSICPTHPSKNHFPQVFFWETKKKNGEVAPKRLFRWRVGVRKGRRLAGAIQVPLGERKVVGMKSEIHDLLLLGCVCFFFP